MTHTITLGRDLETYMIENMSPKTIWNSDFTGVAVGAILLERNLLPALRIVN